MKIVFFGSSRYVIPTIEMLRSIYNLSLVVTTEQNNQDAVPFYCKSKKINFLSVRKTADLISSKEIENSGARLGVVADFGLIIPDQLINFFELGIINIHPSLLPKYRGPTPVQGAILNGETKTGVSIIKLDKYMDHGPILAFKEEEILPEDTTKTLYERLFKIGTKLLQDVIQNVESQNIKNQEQNHESATFTKLLKKDDGFIDLKTISNKAFFDRLIRAYYPWPGVWAKFVLDPNKEAKVVKFLPENKIQVEGGKEMYYKDFINGYPNAEKTLLEFLQK